MQSSIVTKIILLCEKLKEWNQVVSGVIRNKLNDLELKISNLNTLVDTKNLTNIEPLHYNEFKDDF